jgi:molybdopterin molybdotransferase
MLRNLHPDEALKLILSVAQRLWPEPDTERLDLAEAAGRVIPRALESPIDHPPFNKSAMDGFAYGEIFPGAVYRVIDMVAAGKSSDMTVKPGEIVRIMTGAPLPAGTRAVQRIEWTEDAGLDEEGNPLVRFMKRESVDNVIRKGENLAKGEILLTPRRLMAQDIGILASGGFATVTVSRQPRVGIVSTGDELFAAGRVLPPAAIFDSNGPQLCAQAGAAGGKVAFFGILPDAKSALFDGLSKALDGSDIVLVSGGVSMGDFDLVPAILTDLGVETLFHSLAMRPGKPTYFGIRGKTAVFGLPGNPVSTFVNFEVLVKQYLYMMMGIEYRPSIVAARLGTPLARRGADRVEFLPARLSPSIESMSVMPIKYHGSSMINALAEADVLLRMELGQDRIEEGTTIYARRIRA